VIKLSKQGLPPSFSEEKWPTPTKDDVDVGVVDVVDDDDDEDIGPLSSAE